MTWAVWMWHARPLSWLALSAIDWKCPTSLWSPYIRRSCPRAVCQTLLPTTVESATANMLRELSRPSSVVRFCAMSRASTRQAVEWGYRRSQLTRPSAASKAQTTSCSFAPLFTARVRSLFRVCCQLCFSTALFNLVEYQGLAREPMSQRSGSWLMLLNLLRRPVKLDCVLASGDSFV